MGQQLFKGRRIYKNEDTGQEYIVRVRFPLEDVRGWEEWPSDNYYNNTESKTFVATMCGDFTLVMSIEEFDKVMENYDNSIQIVKFKLLDN